VKRIRRPSAAAVLGVVFALLGAVWGGYLGARHVAGTSSALDRFENVSLDWRQELAGSREAPRGVVVAAIDDETVARAGVFPIPRAALARIVRGLAASDPQAIAIDILLLDPGPPEADLELADTLRSTKAVIAAAALFDRGKLRQNNEPGSPAAGDELLPEPTGIIWPQEKFSAVARSGLTNISTDQSGAPRHVPMLFAVGDKVVPSMALATVAAALNTDPVLGNDVLNLAARTVSVDLGYNLPLRFYGPKGGIRTFSAIRAATGEADPDDIRGQIIIIGSTAAGVGDHFATPFDRAMPGVEVLATAMSNLLAGDGLVRNRLTRRLDAVVAVLLPIVLVALLAARRIAIALTLAGLVFGIWILAVYAAFLKGYWLSVALPAASSIPTAIAYGAVRLWIEERAAKQFASEGDALRRFQPPRLVALLTSNPQFLTQPVHQRAAIVFVDLTGFTGVTESLGPAWTRELLAALHERIEEAATGLQGFVLNYMGDGAMIVFGLPAPKEDDACRALHAVTRLHQDLSKWIADLPPVASGRLAPRLGAHFGQVVLSRLGAATHQHITAAGDTVNVASRLVEVAKEYRAAIVVSEDLYRAAIETPDCKIEHRDEPAIEIGIRGRAHPVLVRMWGGAAST
jgi:adenylate cyclase